MQHPNFCFSYWLFFLGSQVFVLAFWQPLAWLLVEQSLELERLLLVSPDVFYKRFWSNSGSVWLSMKVPRCFLFLDSFFTKRGSRGLAFSSCLPVGHTLHCWWLFWPHTLCHLLLQTPSFFLTLVELCYPLALFWWYLALAVIGGIHHVFCTS